MPVMDRPPDGSDGGIHKVLRRPSFWLRLWGTLKGATRYFSDPYALALAGAIERSSANPHCIKSVIADGANVNAKGRQGVTPLMYAILRSKPSAFRILLEEGADANATSDNGQGVMSLAAVHPDLRFLGIALDLHGDPNTRDRLGYPILTRAVENHLVSHVSLLLDRRANIDAKDERTGNCPLGVAVMMGWEDLVSLLITRGANADLRNHFEATPRSMAHEEWTSPAVRLAFEHPEELSDSVQARPIFE
jgi:ankyrin repeat protein